jgi:hypothetical protein
MYPEGRVAERRFAYFWTDLGRLSFSIGLLIGAQRPSLRANEQFARGVILREREWQVSGQYRHIA